MRILKGEAYFEHSEALDPQPPKCAGPGWSLTYRSDPYPRFINEQRGLVGEYMLVSGKPGVEEYVAEWTEKKYMAAGYNLRTVQFEFYDDAVFYAATDNVDGLLKCIDPYFLFSFIDNNAEKLLSLKLFSKYLYRYWTSYIYGHPQSNLEYMLALYGCDGNRPTTDPIPASKIQNGSVVVYRGTAADSYRLGVSWSLSKYVAKFFANKHGNGKGIIFRGKVKVSDIVFYTNRRHEKEVVVLPSSVTDIERFDCEWTKADALIWEKRRRNP